jgi:hypothetical protein
MESSYFFRLPEHRLEKLHATALPFERCDADDPPAYFEIPTDERVDPALVA